MEPSENRNAISNEDQDDLISVARIARPRGVRGEVIADLLTDFPDRFSSMDMALVKIASGEMMQLKLQRAWMHQGRIVLKFEGYDDIDRAEKLRDAKVLVRPEQLVMLPSDTFYEFDLIDCDVETIEGAHIGKVVEVQSFGAAPLLVVRSEEHREYMIPFTQRICPAIDISSRRIRIDPPEGLLDL